MIDRRGQVAEFEHRTIVDAEDRGRRGDGGREGLTRAAVDEAAAFDADGAPGAVGVLGGVHGQRTGADLGQHGVGRVIEPHEASREGGVGVVVADVEGRRARGAEDLTRAGERAPGGGLAAEVVTGARGDRQVREARTGVAGAVTEAACEDVEVAGEAGLGVELEDAQAGLGDRAGGGDDGLQLQGRAQGIDVADAVDVDRADVDGAARRAEAEPAFDDADGADVGRGGEDAARADGQDALGARAVAVQGVERADGGVARRADVVEDEPVLGVVPDVVQHARARDRGVIGRGETTGGEQVHGRAAHDEPLEGIGRGGDVRSTLDMERALVDEGAAGVGVRAGETQHGAARLGERDGLGAVGDIGADALVAATLGVDEELGTARSERALAVDGADGVAGAAEEEEAARRERQGLAGGDVDGVGGRAIGADIAHAEAVQGGVRGDDDGPGDDGVEVDVVGRSGQRDRVGRGRQVGVRREAVRAERGDAEARDGGREVAGIGDGPAAEDAAGEAGVRRGGVGQVGAVEVADDHAGRRADLAVGAGEVDRAAAHRAVEAGDVELRGTADGGGTVDVDERVRGGQGDHAEQLGRGGLLAAAQFQDAAAQRDGGRVVEAVGQADRAVGVVEVEAAVVDLDRGGVDQAGVVAQEEVAAVDDGRTRVGVRGVEVGGLGARAGELHVALDRAGPVAGGVVVVDQEVARGERGVRDDGVAGVVILVGEDAVEELRAAVEVQRAAHERGEVVGLDGVGEPGAEAHGTLVEHELAAQGIGADGGQARDRRGRRIEHEGARAGLDHRHAGVRGAATAVDRGVDRQDGGAHRPDVERGAVEGLVEHAAGDAGRAAVADQDAAGDEREADAVTEEEAGGAGEGEGVGDDVSVDEAGPDVVQLDVVVRRDRGRVFARLQRTDDAVRRAGVAAAARLADGGEVGAEAVDRDVGQGPREDALAGGAVGAVRPVEGRTAREDDVGIARVVGDAEVLAAEEHGSAAGVEAAGGRVLGRGDVVGRAEEDHGHLAGQVLLEGDRRGATAEGRLAEVLGEAVVDARAAADHELAAAETDFLGVGAGGAETAVGGRVTYPADGDAAVVEPEGGTLVDEDARGPGAGFLEGGQAALEMEPLGGVDRDVVRVADAQRAEAVLAHGVELGGAGNGERRAVDDDGAAEVGIEADGTAGRGVGDAAGDAERGARAGAEGGVEGEGDRTGVGVVAAEARELAGEVGAAVEHVVDALQAERVGDRDVVGELDAGAAPVVRRGGDGARTGGVAVREAERAGLDGDRAGPAGVVRGEFQDAGVALAERTIGVAAEGERRGQRERAAEGDLEGIVVLTEYELAGGGEGARGAEADAEEAVRAERDAVAGGAQGGVGIGGEHAAEDVEGATRAAERVDAAELEGARAGLDQAVVVGAVVDHAREDEAGVLDEGGRGADGEVGRAGEGGRAGELKAVAAEVRDGHDVPRDGEVALLQDLVAGVGAAAGAVDRDGRVAGEDERAAEDDLLEGAAAVAVIRDADAAGDDHRAGVVADVQDAEAALVDDVARARGRGVADRDGEQRVEDVDVPDGRQRGHAREGQRLGRGGSGREERVAEEGGVVGHGPGAGGDQRGVRRHGEHARAQRAGGDDAGERVAVAAEGEAARGDGDAAREGAGARELEHAGAGLHDAAVLDDGHDVERRLEGREVDAVGLVGADGEGRGGLAAEVHRAVGEAGDAAGVAARHGDAPREGGRAREVERRVVRHRQAREAVGLVGEGHGRGRADGKGLRRDDAAEGLDEGALDDHEAAGAEARRGPEIEGPAVDDGAAGVGVDAADVQVARAAVARPGDEADRLGAVVGDDGVEVSDAVRPAVIRGMEIQVTAREAAGDRPVADGVGPIVAVDGGHEAAAHEGQRVAAEIEGATVATRIEIERIDRDVLDEAHRGGVADPDVVRRQRAGEQAGAGIAAHSSALEAGDAGHRIVGGEVTVDDGPRADDAVGQGEAAVDDDADAVRLAEAGEVIEAQHGGRAGGTGQPTEDDAGGVDVPTAAVDIDLVTTLDERHDAEALGDVSRRTAGEQDLGAAEGDRSRVAETVGDIIERARVVDGEEAAAGDVEGRRAEDAAGVGDAQVADDEGRSRVGFGEVDRGGAGADLDDGDVAGDRAVEGRLAVEGQGRLGAGAVDDGAAAGVLLSAEVVRVEVSGVLDAAVEVEGGAVVHAEAADAVPEGVGRAGLEAQRARVDGRVAADELRRFEAQRAREGLRQAVGAGHGRIDREGLAGGHVEEPFGA